CDGARPQCSPCASRAKTCTYAELNARDTRLETLERLFQTLRTCTPGEVEGLLRRIRGNERDLSSLLGSIADGSPGPIRPEQQDEKSTKSAGPCSVRTSVDIASEALPDLIGRPRLDRSPCCPTSNDNGQPTTTISGSNRYAYLGLPWIPDPEVARYSVDSFFESSGKLFHLFSREQAAKFYDTIYHPKGVPSLVELDTALGCLCAVAAVGSQYIIGPYGRQTEKAIYNTAKRYLDTILESYPLEAVKVCTLLALYNIMGKGAVALAYVEIGLSLCRRYSLDSKKCQQSGLTQAEWRDYRGAWRTLLFFSSWLSSTLGYISGNDLLATGLSVGYRIEPDRHIYITIYLVIQNELVRIAFLKTHTLRVQLAFKELTVPTMKSIMDDLQDWYRKLPKELHLSNIGEESLSVESKRSLCHVHLLYLGVIMLLYRRIASQFFRFTISDDRVLWKPMGDVITKYSKEAISAAEHTARILKLLMGDNGVFKRCWLVIFQAYTACLVLFHSVSQKLVHNIPLTSFGDELEQSRNCLLVLAFCATADPVAQQFHERLSAFHDKIQDHISTNLRENSLPENQALGYTASTIDLGQLPTPREGNRDGVNAPAPETSDVSDGLYLLYLQPTAAPSLGELSKSIFARLCQPFRRAGGDGLSEP
ncbi:hypothetical protein GQ53DRAFT_596221, partial [Thozetella sp. PMI_491]